MKIFGIGMNYAAHNKELQNSLLNIEDDSAQRSQPVVFTKADSALLTDGRPFFIPSYTKRCEYETELCVRINHLGRSIPERFAHRYYEEVTVGIDFTARDLQEKFRKEGLPWDLCKGFDGSAAVGKWMPLKHFGKDVQNLHFHLLQNGKQVQTGYTADMLFGVNKLVSFISQYFTLKTGDIIFTGTPAGIGPVNIEDHLEGYLEGEKVLEFNVK